MMMSADEISERLIVGFESFVSLGIAFLSTVTGAHIQPLSTPAICHLYGSETPTTEFFLETRITEEDDVCVASDWLVLLFQFLVIHAFSWWSRWLILEPMARICLGKPRATKSRVQKFAQALIQTIFHVLSACCAWRILATQSWLLVPETWSQPGDPTVAPDLKFYYLLYAARYVSDTVSLWFEHGKSDTWAYAVHHVVSVALVLGSIMAGYIRIGCVIMFFMDWVDPFLLTAKMCRYLSSNPHDGYQFVANRLFEVFGILFFLTRNVLLIYVVWICVRDFPQGARTLKGLCVVLVMVQVFWLVSILQTARIQYTNKGNVDDFRSDVDETEYEHEQDDVLQQTGGIVARKKKRKKHKKH